MTTLIIVLLIIIAAAAAWFALLLNGLLKSLKYSMRPKKAPDLTQIDLKNTRWELIPERIVRDVKAIRAHPWQDAYITSFDGLKLHARCLPGTGERAALLIHGYRSSWENDFAGIADWYIDRGFTVILPDQRGQGGSEGAEVTYGICERRDAVAWAEYAHEKFGGQLWIHGISMGAASVLMGMPLGYPDGTRGIIADCPFNSPQKLFAFQLKRHRGLPSFPAAALAALAWRMAVGAEAARLNCSSCSAGSALPVLFFSAGQDITVPQGAAEEIWCARGRRDELIHIETARHALCWHEDTERYSSALSEFTGVK